MAKLPIPKFNLRLPNAEAPTLIYLVLRYKGKRIVHSTGHSIVPSDWDFKQQRPIQQTRRPDLFLIKRKLDDLVSHCLTLMVDPELESASSKEMKERLDIFLGREVKRKDQKLSSKAKPTFLEFLDSELAEIKAKNGLEFNTTKAYSLHISNLKKFAKEVRLFDYDDVDWDFRLELIDWLQSKGHKLSYGNKTLNKLKQFLELARKKKLHTNTYYLGNGWSVPSKKAIGEKVILTLDELQALHELQLSGLQEIARDLFLIGAGTGQRFSDYHCYTPHNFHTTQRGIPVLSIISQKTKTPSVIPLTIFPWLIPTLEKYGYHSPTICMANFNKIIKLLCKRAGLDKDVFIVEQYIGRKATIKKKYVPKYQEVSSHTCRRSFSTNLYRMGYSLAQIMPMTGHATESQLREYIGIDNEMNAEQIAFSIMENRGNSKRSASHLKVISA